MCGRYVITSPVSKSLNLVKKSINVDDVNNYNAHPQQLLPVIKKYINGNTLENKKGVSCRLGPRIKILNL